MHSIHFQVAKSLLKIDANELAARLNNESGIVEELLKNLQFTKMKMELQWRHQESRVRET